VTRITATEAARSFSEVLTRVSQGEEIEVTRNGATVAVIGPPTKKRRLVPAEDLRALLSSLPPVDEDFVRDLEQIRRESGFPGSAWPS
jgi:prevent-host-death family protein